MYAWYVNHPAVLRNSGRSSTPPWKFTNAKLQYIGNCKWSTPRALKHVSFVAWWAWWAWWAWLSTGWNKLVTDYGFFHGCALTKRPGTLNRWLDYVLWDGRCILLLYVVVLWWGVHIVVHVHIKINTIYIYIYTYLLYMYHISTLNLELLATSNPGHSDRVPRSWGFGCKESGGSLAMWSSLPSALCDPCRHGRLLEVHGDTDSDSPLGYSIFKGLWCLNHQDFLRFWTSSHQKGPYLNILD